MTAIELQILFEDKMGRFMSNDIKVFNTLEIQRFLNEAQEAYVQGLSDLYEYNEKARRSLTKLTKSKSLSPEIVIPVGIIALDNNSSIVDISALNILRIVEEQITTVIDIGRIPVIPITHDQYLANIKNPFKKPYYDLVWRIDVDGYIELITDGSFAISKYEVRYIEHPTLIDIEQNTVINLAEIDASIIAEIAVEMAVKALSVGRPKE